MMENFKWAGALYRNEVQKYLSNHPNVNGRQEIIF